MNNIELMQKLLEYQANMQWFVEEIQKASDPIDKAKLNELKARYIIELKDTLAFITEVYEAGLLKEEIYKTVHKSLTENLKNIKTYEF
jgi:hypothetical protein